MLILAESPIVHVNQPFDLASVLCKIWPFQAQRLAEKQNWAKSKGLSTRNHLVAA